MGTSFHDVLIYFTSHSHYPWWRPQFRVDWPSAYRNHRIVRYSLIDIISVTDTRILNCLNRAIFFSLFTLIMFLGHLRLTSINLTTVESLRVRDMIERERSILDRMAPIWRFRFVCSHTHDFCILCWRFWTETLIWSTYYCSSHVWHVDVRGLFGLCFG